MASTPIPATLTGITGAALPIPSHPIPRGRPLQREGAQFFPSAAERALEEAMMRSSPPPEPVTGKRVRDADDEPGADDHDTEAEDEASATTSPQPSPLPTSNLIAATLRYASKKKLRPEQRDEVDAFFSVSACLTLSGASV